MLLFQHTSSYKFLLKLSICKKCSTWTMNDEKQYLEYNITFPISVFFQQIPFYIDLETPSLISECTIPIIYKGNETQN